MLNRKSRLRIEQLEARNMLTADFGLGGDGLIGPGDLETPDLVAAEVTTLDTTSALDVSEGLNVAVAEPELDVVIDAESADEVFLEVVQSPQQLAPLSVPTIDRGVDDDSFEILFDLNRLASVDANAAIGTPQLDASPVSFDGVEFDQPQDADEGDEGIDEDSLGLSELLSGTER
jgi:hypothetical protein